MDRVPRPPSSSSIASTAEQCIERLKTLTTCNFCQLQLKEGRILPCHHSFCTSCILHMMTLSTTKDEFLCPKDRKVIKIPLYGVNSFEIDEKAVELGDISSGLEQSTYLCDEAESTAADIDISLESLSKGVKDIEHSSVMSQHDVNMYFENIYKKLKGRQEVLIQEIELKSKRQIMVLEFEKYRLIETKRYQNEVFSESTFYEEEIMESFRTNKSIDASDPPTIVSSDRYPNSTSSDVSLALMSCHVGQQHLEFVKNEDVFERINSELGHVGEVVCDFDVKVKLHRNLLALEEFPFGMKVGSGDTERIGWKSLNPKGIDKGRSWENCTDVVIVNSGRQELIIFDSTLNLKRLISCENRFDDISDVAVYNNNIYVVDSGSSQVIMLDMSGEVLKRFGKMGSGNLELKRPNGIATDRRGRVIVSDSLNHRIKILSQDLTRCILTLSTDRKKYRESMKFSFPCGVACDNDDNIFVADTNNQRIVQLTRDGNFMKEIVPAGSIDPRCIALSSDNKVIITDRENGKVLIMDDNGKSVTYISGIVDSFGNMTRFKQPYGVTVDGTDKIFVSDFELNDIFIL